MKYEVHISRTWRDLSLLTVNLRSLLSITTIILSLLLLLIIIIIIIIINIVISSSSSSSSSISIIAFSNHVSRTIDETNRK